MTVNLGNKPGGSSADSFKGRFQFGKLLAAAPTGDIAERIVRRIKPVMLADGIGDTFRLYFTGAPVGAGLPCSVFMWSCSRAWVISWIAVFRVCNSLMPSRMAMRFSS